MRIPVPIASHTATIARARWPDGLTSRVTSRFGGKVPVERGIALHSLMLVTNISES